MKSPVEKHWVVRVSPLAQCHLTNYCSLALGRSFLAICPRNGSCGARFPLTGCETRGRSKRRSGPEPSNHPLCAPLQKWQRRFFILYEHGLLRYALDEMVSVLLRPLSDSSLPQAPFFLSACVLSVSTACVLSLGLLLGAGIEELVASGRVGPENPDIWFEALLVVTGESE